MTTRNRTTPNGVTLKPELIGEDHPLESVRGKHTGDYTLECCGKRISKNYRGMWGYSGNEVYPTLKSFMATIDQEHENGCAN